MIDVPMVVKEKGAMIMLEDWRFSIPFISLISIIYTSPAFIILSLTCLL